MTTTLIANPDAPQIDVVEDAQASAKLEQARRSLLVSARELDRARHELHEAYAEARRAGVL
jgi:hypothetical protein